MPRLRCVNCDDSPVVKVHTLVTKFDCQKCVGSPEKIDESLDAVDGATGYLGFEWFAVVIDQYFNVVDRDFGGEVE